MTPLLLALLVAKGSEAQFVVQRVSGPLVIDGRLDDDAWRSAPVSDDFTQNAPLDGASPSERTILRVLYDDEALYIGVECEQRSSPVMQHLTRRDGSSQSDEVSIWLDTRGEGKDAFWVAVNAAGVQSDGTVHDQNVMSLEWDENWEADSVISDGGWSAEFRIPFRILRFPASLPVQKWGLQVVRYIAARQESDQWAHVPRENVNWVANYGGLNGVRPAERALSVELRPFATLRVRRQDAGGETLSNGYDARPSGGLDLKLHLSESLTLDGALNPDFTQVEADQVVLNLSSYETFLAEKRDLFVEGAAAFATPMQEPMLFGSSSSSFLNRIFYSRRVGSAPLSPALRSDASVVEQLVEPVSPSTIYGAAKLVGNLGRGWSVGALSATTGRNEMVAQDRFSGAQSHRPVDPATSFNVLRIKRRLGDQSHVGVIATGVTRFDDGAGYGLTAPGTQLCPSGATVPAGSRCFHDAYVAAVDGLWRSPSGAYMLATQATGSLIRNGAPIAPPDGTMASGNRGAGVWVRAARQGGKNVLLLAEYTGAGRTLDYNDAGYMARANLHEARAVIAYRTLDPGPQLLESYTALSSVARWSFLGLNLGQTLEATTRLRLASFWTVSATAAASPARFDDREIGDGRALERPAWVSGQVDVATNPGRAVVATLSAQGLRHRMGTGATAQASVLVNVLPQLNAELSAQWTDTRGEFRFVPHATTTDGDDIFGRLQASSASATLRTSYAFKRQLSLQTYAQLFLAAGRYSDFRRFGGGLGAAGPLTIAELVSTAAPAMNPDFERAALNLNAVLRWEYRLGSTLYLVYTRAQAPEVTLDPGQPAALRFGSLLRSPAADVILLKASFWWAS